MSSRDPVAIGVLAVELLPALALGLFGQRMARAIARWPKIVRIGAPACLVIPYLALAGAYHVFSWQWFVLYSLLPVAMAWLMIHARSDDPEQRGNWRDALILLTLGLAVDLRLFDVAWPAGLRGWGNLLLVDAGLYAFLGIRQVSGTGFDFHFRWQD